jgi:hypothetical protein
LEEADTPELGRRRGGIRAEPGPAEAVLDLAEETSGRAVVGDEHEVVGSVLVPGSVPLADLAGPEPQYSSPGGGRSDSLVRLIRDRRMSVKAGPGHGTRPRPVRTVEPRKVAVDDAAEKASVRTTHPSPRAGPDPVPSFSVMKRRGVPLEIHEAHESTLASG